MWTLWIEGEFGGSFDTVEDALAEAAISALSRSSSALLVNETEGRELIVDVRARDSISVSAQ